ncbi:DUF6228 family protein [Streptomyces sp. NPDC058284]|uniref:DUF6228 family protein n=1 Tax=unclassified Streptomyces TaxID=2593676 RepID=UPI0036528FCB
MCRAPRPAQWPGSARYTRVVAWIWGSDLTTFLEELAADYRGWGGQRSWQTNDQDLTVPADFGSGGHVGLTWALRPWPQAAGGWRLAAGGWVASVTT